MQSPIPSIMPHLVETFSDTASICSSVSRKRRAAKEKLELNTKVFKMSDLSSWKPRTENELRKKWDAKRQEMLDKMDAEDAAQPPRPESPPKATSAPRVKLNEKGEMVIDAESLVIADKPDEQLWETVNDDYVPKKLNSASFRKRPLERSSGWSETETDLFYRLLSATGCDFGLMHEFMPSRSRSELKKKFKKEERVNMDRVNETLKKPSLLHKDLHETAKAMMEKVEAERIEKLELKKNRKIRKKRPTVGRRTDLDLADDQEEEEEDVDDSASVVTAASTTSWSNLVMPI